MKVKIDGFEKGFWILSLLLLISVPFGYFYSSLLFGLWMALSIIWIVRGKHFKINRSILPFFGFSALFVISVLWSTDTQLSLQKLPRQLPLLLIAVAGLFLPKISMRNYRIFIRNLLVFFAVFALVMIGIALSKYIKFQYQGFLFYHELVSPLELNAIYVSYLVSVILVVGLVLIKKKTLIDYFSLFVLSIFLVMLASKMILFITLAVIGVIVVSNLKKMRVKVIVFGGILLSVVLLIVLVKPIQNRFVKEINTSVEDILNQDRFEKGRVYTGSEARLLQMRAYKEIIQTPKEFVFGLGLSASKERLREVHKRLNTPAVFQEYNFHNQYLQTLADIGLIGLILMLATLWIGFRRGILTRIHWPFIVISAALFVTESVLYRQRGILVFGLFYIMSFLIKSTDESTKQFSKV